MWLAAAALLLFQTRVCSDQLAQKFTVVEHAVCTAPTCTGLELFRVRYQDGTTRIFVAAPMPSPTPPWQAADWDKLAVWQRDLP